jgi:hypothetical protein
MILHNSPQPDLFTGLAPAQIKGIGPQKPLERLRGVPGMERHKAHPAQHPVHHPVHHPVINLVMLNMPPPDQHIRIVQRRLAQGLPVILLSSAANSTHRVVLFQKPLNRAVDPPGIERPHRLYGRLMEKFVKNRHIDLPIHIGTPQKV